MATCSADLATVKTIYLRKTVALSELLTWTVATVSPTVDKACIFSRLLGVARTLTVCCGTVSLNSLSHSATTKTGQLVVVVVVCWTRFTSSRRSGRPHNVVILRRDGRHCADRRRRVAIVPLSSGTVPQRRADGCG